MSRNTYNIIGVMSGTSLDGIDLVYAEFWFDKTWRYNILKAETIPYSQTWKNRLKNLVNLSEEQLEEIDVEYTRFLGEVIKAFIAKNKITSLDIVSSHGHTALHQPEKGLTYQIGNRPEFAQLIGHLVVCDFRVQDVELGGQGAPLVPVGDKLLFSDYDFCLNLGGFANISTTKNGQRIAYDICPVNIILNHYAQQLGKPYDESGTLASSGTVNAELLSKLNALSFYAQEPPKSLGLEWTKKEIFSILEVSKETPQNILRTFIEHIAVQIASEIISPACQPEREEEKTVLVTGGGAYNSFLMDRLEPLSKQSIVIPDKSVVEFKEALVFGLLGILKLRGEINCLKSVTGARKDHSSGKVFGRIIG